MNSRVYTSFQGSKYAYSPFWYILFWLIAFILFVFTMYLDVQKIDNTTVDVDDIDITICTFHAPVFVFVIFALINGLQVGLFTLLFAEPLRNLAVVSQDAS